MSKTPWNIEIKPVTNILDINIPEILRFKDLLFLFVKRDIVTVYKQTVLGPLWYIIQPILTTLMFTFVFGRLANIPTGGTPHIIFYLLGVTIWNYFSECLSKTSNTFVINQNIFGKVYFPRVIVPASLVISNLGKFSIQFMIFFVMFIYYFSQNQIHPNAVIVLLPLIIFIMAIISLGLGMIFSSLTTKYRDLSFLLTFGIQLWMYATPVIYPLSAIPEKYVKYILYNPITPLIETMRYGFFGVGTLNFYSLGYSLIFGIGVLFLGLVIFNKVEKTFMDTV